MDEIRELREEIAKLRERVAVLEARTQPYYVPWFLDLRPPLVTGPQWTYTTGDLSVTVGDGTATTITNLVSHD